MLALANLVPEIIVTVVACIILAVSAALKGRQDALLGWLTFAGLVAALIAIVAIEPTRGDVAEFNGSLAVDNFSYFLRVLVLLVALITVLISPTYVRQRDLPPGEYYAVLLLCLVGMMILCAARDLITVFVGIELMAIGTYIMAGLARFDQRSTEAALKYFLLGAFASAILMYGFAWLYGVTGTTQLGQIGAYLGKVNLTDPPLSLALVLVTVGLGFKIAAVPFHAWTPDTYEGAPTPVTAFMSVGPKAASFAAVLRIFVEAMGPLKEQYAIMLAVIAILTMTVGNVVAIAQSNVVRMLAYSTIAHTGYLLVGVASVGAPGGVGVSSVLFYAFVYVFMNMGAFAIVIYLLNSRGNQSLSSFDGLSRRAPLAALGMTIFLLSLAGVPPTAGFFGKWYLLDAALSAGMPWLAVALVLNSAVAAFYYIRIILNMYMREVERPQALAPSWLIGTAATVSVIAVLLLGILPDELLKAALGSVL